MDKNFDKALSSRKRRNIKRKFILFVKITAIFLLLGALVFGFNYLYNSRYFKIKIVMVTGNSHYSSEQVKKVADVAIGANIFEINKKNIEDKLAAELTWVSSSSLRKVFPDKIEISITERKPYIRLVYGGKYFILDKEAVVLDEISGEEPFPYSGYLLVKNGIKFYPEIGEKIAKKSILGAAAIYDALDVELKSIVKEAYISSSTNSDIILITFDNKQIIFGTSDKIADKNVILKQILIQIYEDEITYSIIDLRNIENPVIK
jgi:cell division septal protein FtsQ